MLAEASSFGCIPIIPSIPAIISNINEQKKNGIILEDINPQGIRRTIENLSQMRAQLSEYSKNAMQEVGIDTATFATGLRSALRQDPDVVAIGELRDVRKVTLKIVAK